MATDGELSTSQAEGDPAAAVEEIRAGFRERAQTGELLAAGTCTAVTLDDDAWPNGVSIQLEHRDGEPFTLIHPYRSEGDDVEWGEAFRVPGERHVWPATG